MSFPKRDDAAAGITGIFDREDSIVAVATPPGRGAIAVVRLSGRRAIEIARRHITPWPAEARVASLCDVTEEGAALDQALVTLYPGPDSFTGEDVVEVSTHGGYVAPASVAAAFIRSGARQALPGEFTRRAVLNGKLDLIQAESIGELINARSSAMQRAAVAQLHGELTRKLSALREGLLSLEALIAYEIDFPEEDDGPVSEKQIERATTEVREALEQLASTASFGELIREGAVVVIAGSPNSGKSSLFNALLGKARAIVTDLPGTTRDALEAVIEFESWPLRLVDTAGLRDTTDRIERLGIEISERYVASGDVVLVCAETSRDLGTACEAVRSITPAPILPVRTKADMARRQDPPLAAGDDAVFVSAVERTGLETLLARIVAILGKTHGDHTSEAAILTTARQTTAVNKALTELESFVSARTSGQIPATIAAVHIRAAAAALEELIGSIDVDDVLARLFSTFCVGK